MRARALIVVVPIALGLGLAASSRAAPTAAGEPTHGVEPASAANASTWRARLERLSVELRARRLDDKERDDATAAFAKEDPRAVYERSVDAWMDRDFFRRFAARTVRRPGRVSKSTFQPLAKAKDASGKKDVYFLAPPRDVRTPAASDAPGERGAPPCPASEQRTVRPWWSLDRPITICASSYRPEKAFDEIGFCGGQADPKIPAPPRSGCGCGPFLMACTPPHEEGALDDRIDEAAQDEAIETFTEVLAADQPYENVLQATSTWQSGLVEFLYARREMLKELSEKPYDASFQARWGAKLAKVDVQAKPRWVRRTGVYEGAGIFLTTPVSEVAYGTYRDQMRSVLTAFLCARFDSVNVNRDVLLQSVAGHHNDVRALKVHESPMRFQTGCSGCHAPMDFGAAFLVEIRTPLFGSFPVQEDARGKLYVNGANDYRGDERGLAGLARLIAKQPDFGSCTVDTTFQALVGRKPAVTERTLTDALAAGFQRDHHAMRPLVRQILLSPPYLSPVEFE